MNRRYLEIDYDRQIVIEYKRAGECNQCAACCWAYIQYGQTGNEGNSGLGGGTTHKGIWHGVLEDGKYYLAQTNYIKPGHQTCSALLEGGKCDFHNEKNYKDRVRALCDIYPTNPTEIVLFPKCSYSFEKIGEWPMPEIWPND